MKNEMKQTKSETVKIGQFVVVRWYDCHTRSWVIQTKDNYGNQVGEASYVGTESGAIAEVNARAAGLKGHDGCVRRANLQLSGIMVYGGDCCGTDVYDIAEPGRVGQ